jgi:hypothetical protein
MIMIINKLPRTVLGIKNNWYRRHLFYNDSINLPKPVHHHKSVLDDLINKNTWMLKCRMWNKLTMV